MQIGNVIGVAAFGAGCFYAGFRFHEYRRKRKALEVYEATVELLKEDFETLKKTVEKSSSEVKKRVKEQYDELTQRYNNSLHRPELLDALRHDVNELMNSLKI